MYLEIYKKKVKEFLKYLQIKDMMHEISMILSKE